MAIWNTGEKNGFWKGGRIVTPHGYVLIRVGKDHPCADTRGYAYEHRLIAAEKIGRPLMNSEKVHHIDGNKQNNSPENLEVCTSLADHKAKHRTKCMDRKLPNQENIVIFCACGCGNTLNKFDGYGRPRKYKHGHSRRKQNV
ncbi:HNH endonuclease [Oryzomonas rubra]|uniref:HNH endonuclease n=1 Tax=Oryzomonas rubra TaxID=2509454 RepID=A0A5A9X8Q7_9BACT|nr:HNH endonuclease [Oryzomonas rubra]KAA0888795.1 HNH endonuclease [Oryzomonas rubra]